MISNHARLTRRFLRIARNKRGILDRYYSSLKQPSTNAETSWRALPLPYPKRDW